MGQSRGQSDNPLSEPPTQAQAEPQPRAREMSSALDEDLPGGFAPGTLIGRYRLLAPLASGGMAHVWAAKPEGAGFAKTVALKLVRREYSGDEEYARMFIDEATVASSVHHPNVCETYELGRHEDVLYMALEWIAGDSLGGLIHQGSTLLPLDTAVAARITAEALAGLHAAHEAVGPDGNLLNIVHRDISPPNILISIHGQVKVSDFGIAKARYQLHSKTRTGEIKGKFAYIAPEQIIGKNVDRRCDIYSMACVLYMATVGLRPFGTGPRAMTKILKGEYKRPSEIIEGYPLELESIVMRALSKDPDQRYATAEDMRIDLEEYLLNCGKSVSHTDVARVVRERLTAQKKAAIEGLLNTNKFLPDVLAYRMFDLGHEHTQTPTAASGINAPPKALRTSVQLSSRTPTGPRGKPMVRYPVLGAVVPDDGSQPRQGRPELTPSMAGREIDPDITPGRELEPGSAKRPIAAPPLESSFSTGSLEALRPAWRRWVIAVAVLLILAFLVIYLWSQQG